METPSAPSQTDNKNMWARIYTRVGTYWKGLAVAILFMAGAAATQPTLAVAMKPLLDEGFSGAKPEYVAAQRIEIDCGPGANARRVPARPPSSRCRADQIRARIA